MKKSLTLALALVALAVFTGPSVGQQARQKDKSVVTATAPELQTSAPPVFQSTSIKLNWPATFGRKQSDLFRSLRGEKLTAQVVSEGAQEIIVIFGDNGQCRVCIGSRHGCAKICAEKSSLQQVQ